MTVVGDHEGNPTVMIEPLTQDQVTAANRLYRLCPGWQLSTDVLDELVTRLTGFDSQAGW